MITPDLNLSECVLCGKRAKASLNQENDTVDVGCDRCGSFVITFEVLPTIRHIRSEDALVLSGCTREQFDRERSKPLLISDANYCQLIEQAPHKLQQRANKILTAIARKSPFFGKKVTLNPEIDYPLGFSKNSFEFKALLGHLEQQGSIQKHGRTPDGWEYSLAAKEFEALESGVFPTRTRAEAPVHPMQEVESMSGEAEGADVIRDRILETILDIQERSRQSVEAAAIAAKLGLDVKEVEGHLQILAQQAHLELHKTLNECFAELTPGQMQTLKERLASQKQAGGATNRPKVFLVHGHKQEVLQKAARFLERMELNPIILFEQEGRGDTIIEKLERHSEVPFAVVLMTADDLGKAQGQEEFKARARQNVVLELGYFIGKLGRSAVAVLYEENVEMPSDYHGVEYTPIDPAEAWKLKLARELRAAGLPVDLNRL